MSRAATVDDVLKKVREQFAPDDRQVLVWQFEQRVNAANAALGLIGIPDHELSAHCAHVVKQLPQIDGAWISIITARRQHVRAAVGNEFVSRLEGNDDPLANSLCSQVVGNLEALVAKDVTANPVLRSCANGFEGAYAGVPLVFRGATVGTLAISGPKGTLDRGVLPVLEREVELIEAKMMERVDVS